MRTHALPASLLVVAAVNAAAADTRLTIYSGDFDAVAASQPAPGMPGFALVREAHEFELVQGANTLTLSGLPAGIDAAGVRFDASGNARVTGQRFDFALADQGELLRRALGQRVTVEQAVGDQRQSYSGVLIAAGDGLTLALDDGRVRVLRDYTAFELAQLPDGLYARPTLRWNVQADKAGPARFELEYPTGGLSWRAEYVARLTGAGEDCRMDFSGAAQVANRSGAAYANASLTLVAGQPNVQRSVQPQMMMAKASMEVSDGAAAPQPSGEYHAYTLPGRVDLPESSVQRVPLLADAAGVACVRRYESQPPWGDYRPPRPLIEPEYGPVGEQPVMAMLEFANRKADGLGVPLPAGRLRAFVRERNGAEAFLGEASLAHTASGREVRVPLGQAFDLSVERTREKFELEPDRRGLFETISLTLRNAKTDAATVRLLEPLPRWREWEVVESSPAWRKTNAQTVAFDVTVPGGGEATVRYRVRYRWPESITP